MALVALITGLLGLAFGSASPVRADSSEAECQLSWADRTRPDERGPCWFSQRQGNVDIRFGARAFHYPAADQGRVYQRSNSSAGIRFRLEGLYSLQVRWRLPSE